MAAFTANNTQNPHFAALTAILRPVREIKYLHETPPLTYDVHAAVLHTRSADQTNFF